MKADKEVMEACRESREPTSVEPESKAEHEVPKKERTVKPVGAMKKQHGDWNLAIGCCKRRRNGPRVMVGPGRCWPPPAEE
jgi:hypothetical protein